MTKRLEKGTQCPWVCLPIRPTPAGEARRERRGPDHLRREVFMRPAARDGVAAEAGVKRLRQLVEMLDVIEAEISDQAAAVVADGGSWADVAWGLGVTRQAAHKRFGGSDG